MRAPLSGRLPTYPMAPFEARRRAAPERNERAPRRYCSSSLLGHHGEVILVDGRPRDVEG